MEKRTGVGESKKLGVVIGGSGLVGGTIVNYFKTRSPEPVEILAPSSKKLSLREPSDIRGYLQAARPDFVINAAIADINSDAQLSYEVNYLGPVHLARCAARQNIPYIHISSAATLRLGEDIREEDKKPFAKKMSNYTRSKLMMEKTLEFLHREEDLDYTCIRLAAVYGNHDHKIQGIQRMIFSVADESMPFLFTKKGVLHSYSNCRKLPFFIHQAVNDRQEYGGGDYNFVDRNPVELGELVMTIKSYLQLGYPKEIYVPYHLANLGKKGLAILLRLIRKFGLKSQLPSELVFLSQFYITQTLNSDRLRQSSFKDPFPEETIYSRLPEMIIYYLTRWSHQNLISTFDEEARIDRSFARTFVHEPERILQAIHSGQIATGCREEEEVEQKGNHT